MPHDRLLIRQILARMRHDGCEAASGEGGVAHRRGGRQQPTGAQDRAARRRIFLSLSVLRRSSWALSEPI